MTENAIEFYTEDETATLSLYRKRFINRIRKLKEQRPDEVDIVENADGSIFAHIPVSWIKIKPTRIMSNEQREELRNRVANARLSRTLKNTNEIDTDFES